MNDFPDASEQQLTTRPRNEGPVYAMPSGPPPREQQGLLMEYWQTVRARLRWVVLAAIAGIALGVIFTFTLVPVFRTHASIKVPEQAQGIEAYATHVKMIQSEALKVKAMADLRFAVAKYPPHPTDRITQWRSMFGLSAPGREEAMSEAVSSLEARVAGITPILDLFCESTDRRIAADYLNLIANEYVNQLNGGGAEQEGAPTMADEIEKARRALDQSEAALEEAQQVRSAPGGSTDAENRSHERSRQIEQAHADRETRQAAYEAGQGATNPELARISNDAGFQSILSDRDESKTNIARLKTKYTTAHPAVVEAQAKLDELEKNIAARRADVLQRLRLDYETAEKKENRLRADAGSEVRTVSAAAAPGRPVSALKREADAKRQNYELLVEKAKHPSKSTSGASVVDAAVMPSIPYKPNPVRNIVFGCLAGLLLGIVSVVVLERVDHTIQRPGEAGNYAGAAELGLIPAMSVKRGAPGYNVELATMQDRLSLTATAFGAAATSLLFSVDTQGGLAPVVVVTSVATMEGKTTSACNLAVAAAEARRRVLLIDGDMIKPRLHSVFALSNDVGLSNLLASTEALGEGALDLAAQASGFTGLDLLTSGNIDAPMAELLHSPRLPELLRLAREKYQMVLIDTPPMIQIPNARVMGRLSDGVILVVRAGKTHRDALQAAAAKLREDGTRLLGTLLNGWDARGRGGYAYEAYTQSYKRYGAGSR